MIGLTAKLGRFLATSRFDRLPTGTLSRQECVYRHSRSVNNFGAGRSKNGCRYVRRTVG